MLNLSDIAQLNHTLLLPQCGFSKTSLCTVMSKQLSLNEKTRSLTRSSTILRKSKLKKNPYQNSWKVLIIVIRNYRRNTSNCYSFGLLCFRGDRSQIILPEKLEEDILAPNGYFCTKTPNQHQVAPDNTCGCFVGFQYSSD